MGIEKVTSEESVREEQRAPDRMLREGSTLFRSKTKRRPRYTEARRIRGKPGEGGGK